MRKSGRNGEGAGPGPLDDILRFLLIMCICGCDGGCVCVSGEIQKRVSDPLGEESQATVSHLTLVLETELRSSQGQYAEPSLHPH